MPHSSPFRITSSLARRLNYPPSLRIPVQSHRTFTMAAETKMMQANRLRKVFTENKGPAMGFWQMLPGANISRALARAGADWVMVDCEHGCMDGERPADYLYWRNTIWSQTVTDVQTDRAMHEAVSAIAAVGISPIVRIPDMQSWMIKRKPAAGCPDIQTCICSHPIRRTRQWCSRCKSL